MSNHESILTPRTCGFIVALKKKEEFWRVEKKGKVWVELERSDGKAKAREFVPY